MKKSLASCLTSLALLSSMCFSSPLAQVHAEETTPLTTETELETPATSYTPIELNAQEIPIGSTQSITNVKKGTILKFVNIGDFKPDGFPLSDDDTFDTSNINENTLKLVFTKGMEYHDHSRIIFEIKFSEDSDNEIVEGENITLDLSAINNYKTSEAYDVTVTPINGIKIGVTRADLKVGEGFDLNFSDKIRAILQKYFNTENLNGLFDYKIEEITYELTDGHTEGEDFEYIIKDDQDEWKGTISKKSKAGDKILFYASAGIKQLSEGPTEEEPPREEIIDLDCTDCEENVWQFYFPVEFTIVDENDAEEENDGNIVFEVSPKYKKLTQKGETYKIETSVSLEENAGADAKELFDAIVADKDSFKVLFKSANPEVATVSEEGVVTAVANGSTEIVAYIEGYEDELFGVSKVDVEIPTEVAETEEISDASDSSASSSYPKTGENFMAISAAILTLGIAVLAVVFMSKKKDTNEEK